MKKVLIIGGSYFVGRAITDYFISKDYEVSILNRGTSNENIKGCTKIICDRNNKEFMKKSLNGKRFDAVIDVSGLNKSQSEILCESIDFTNVENYIFISSSAVYDADNIHAPFSEEMKMAENKYWGQYGKDKIEAESYLTQFFKNKKTNLYMLRPPYMYGENNYVKRESMIFHHIINNKPIILPGDGSTKIQFLYTRDLANIIEYLISTECEGKIDVFNVGNKECVTFLEWIKSCFIAAGKKTDIILYNYDRKKYTSKDFFPFQDYDDVLDVAKIHKIVKDDTDFIEGLKNSYKWYLDNSNDILMKENVTKNEAVILKELEAR